MVKGSTDVLGRLPGHLTAYGHFSLSTAGQVALRNLKCGVKVTGAQQVLSLKHAKGRVLHATGPKESVGEKENLRLRHSMLPESMSP